jgi:hypothetical protein
MVGVECRSWNYSTQCYLPRSLKQEVLSSVELEYFRFWLNGATGRVVRIIAAVVGQIVGVRLANASDVHSLVG